MTDTRSAPTDTPLLGQEEQGPPSRTAFWSVTKVVAAVGIFGMVACLLSINQRLQAMEDPSLQSTAEVTQTYVVWHQYKPGKAGAWWNQFASSMSDPAAYAGFVTQMEEQGLYDTAVMPMKDQTDGNMFCIWQVKAGTSLSVLQTALDDVVGAGMLTNVIFGPVDTSLGAWVPYPDHFAPERSLRAEGGSSSGFYLAWHTFKPGLVEPWWAKMNALQNDDDKTAEIADSMDKMGLFNHAFMPVSKDGPVFCLWELKAGVELPVLQEVLDEQVGAGMLNNVIFGPMLAAGSAGVESHF